MNDLIIKSEWLQTENGHPVFALTMCIDKVCTYTAFEGTMINNPKKTRETVKFMIDRLFDNLLPGKDK